MSELFHITHNEFFQKVTKRTLNELYRRVSKGILENDIHSRLNRYRVKTRVNNNNCHIFINFLDGNNKIGHISLHIEPLKAHYSNNSKRRGRFHAVNNSFSKTYTLKINKNSNVFMSYDDTSMDPNFKNIMRIVVGVLNEYFNPLATLSLTNSDQAYSSPCISYLSKRINLRNNTRKNV
jgi:hypothetical protein